MNFSLPISLLQNVKLCFIDYYERGVAWFAHYAVHTCTF